jgi:hypothetical protein
MASSLFRN